MRGGGTFFCWTMKRVNAYLAYMTCGDARVDLLPRGGYVCRDNYRPGLSFRGKTPAEAARNAGFWVPKSAVSYLDDVGNFKKEMAR